MTGCNLLDFGKPARQNGKRLPCERLMDENAELWEQIHWLKKGDILHVLTDQEYTDQCERERLMQVSIGAIDKENAELRELVRKARDELVEMYEYMDGGYAWPSIGEDPYFGPFYRQLCSELGVEVDE